jgi:hypothetical protein
MGRSNTIVRCECGYEVAAADEASLVTAIQQHAWDAHRLAFSFAEALAVVLRSELDTPGPREPRKMPPP